MRTMCSALAVSVMLLALGCDDSTTDDGATQFVVSPHAHSGAIISEIPLDERASVRFVDESQSFARGGIGVLVLNASSVAAKIAELRLTPLEVFLAVAPGTAVPRALYDDHYRGPDQQGEATAQGTFPRPQLDLTAPRRVVLSQSVTHSTDRCNFSSMSTAGDYCDLWNDDRSGDTADAWGCVDDQTGNRTVSAGSAAERWLGLCARASIDWKVQIEVSPGAWSDVSGTSVSVGDDDEVFYHSSGFLVNHYRSSITAGSSEHYSSSWARD